MIKVGTYTYKGLDYTMELTGSDWPQHKNHFHAKCGAMSTDYYKTFEGADNKMKGLIDNFISEIPQDIDELVSKLSELLVWTGYEDCELDEAAAKVLITDYINRVKESINEQTV